MKRLIPICIIFLITTIKLIPVNATDPYRDTSLTVNERVNDLIARMTLSEKIAQLGNQAPAISRLGVASYNYWSEALHGVARSGLATSFPQSIALSSTWDPELVYRVASATSDEARVKNNTDGKGLTYWSPTINMARDPRWGRAEENYGEDVCLASQIAVNFIKGMQGDNPRYLKTVATAKHFACNNVEHNRYGISSDVDERSLREYYLPAFKASVTDGKVFSVMSAYNAVNGVPSSANRTLLINILRDEWGFDGYVVSDCDAVANVWDSHHYVATAPEATAISLLNGTDLNCGSTFPDNASAAISAGILTEETIDEALRRIFRARFLLGEFDPASSVPYKSIPADRLDCQGHRDLALEAAREAIVLLKNEDAFLPLHKDSIKKIAVIGPNANAVQLGGYSGTPSVNVSTLQGIADKLGINISNGVVEAENFSDQRGIQTEGCVEGGSNIGYIENGDYVVYSGIDFGDGKAKVDLRVASNTSGGDLEILIDNLNGQSLGKYSIPGTGGWQSWITLTFDPVIVTGIHDVYMKFTGGSGYLFNVNWFRFFNTDDVDPTGGDGVISYAAGCSITGSLDQAEFDKAIEMASNSDVAVIVCGTDLSVTDEGHDRSSLDLPGVQGQLIEQVYRVNPNTVLVLVTGTSLAVNWPQDSLPAILTAWYDGQSQGTAIADALFGDYNPGGKLSTTWYRSSTDLPAMSDYDIKNYRTYMYFTGTPLYVFGHGLSYTTFSYSNLSLSQGTIGPDGMIEVKADITNTGEMTGDEVVQLYIHVQSNMKRPIRELKDFKRISLQPGETKTVTLELKYSDLQYYDEVTRTFMVESSTVDILLGSSSEDIRLQGQVTATGGTVSSTYRQDPFTSIEAEHFENKSGLVSLKPAEAGLSANLPGNNSYIVFRNFNFDREARQFNASLVSVSSNSILNIVLDSLDGAIAGSISIVPDGNPNNFTVQSCELNGISGLRDVYLVLTGPTNGACKIDWFSFQENVTLSDRSGREIPGNVACSLYPNPSTNEFTIGYVLPNLSDVSIDIFNIHGVGIKSIFLADQSAGNHFMRFDAEAENLDNGVYIVKFRTDSWNRSMVMNVVR